MAKELRKSRGEELFAVAVREVFDAVAELRTDQSTEWTEELKESLMEFADIIAEPTDLPPEREFDFEINLETGFQTMMNRVLSPYLGKFCVVYLDDVLIYSKTAEEHLEHIRLVLRELQRHHLHIKLSKCSFGSTSVEFLGHIVETGQIKMDPRKVEAVQQWPVPKTIKDVRGFLGLAGYYRKFIHNFAAIAAPLHDLTKNQPEFVWTPRADAAFRALKDAMVRAPVLSIPDTSADARYTLYTDASGFAVGAVLLQDQGSGLRPVAYHARKMNKHEVHYPVHEQELLAVRDALIKFRCYLDGAAGFTVITDHDTLRHFFRQRDLSTRQVRWLQVFAPYQRHMDIVYKRGAANHADALSRRPDLKDALQKLDLLNNWSEDEADCEINSVLFAMESRLQADNKFYDEIKTAYDSDEYLKSRKALPSWLVRHSNGLLYAYGSRLYVPNVADLRQRALYELHDAPTAGHPGGRRLLARTVELYWWPRMKLTVTNYVRRCPTCQRTKAARHKPYGLLQPHDVPSRPFEVISLDLITDLPECQGYDSLVIFVCLLSKRVIVEPTTKTVTAEGLAEIMHRSVFRHFGLPAKFISDRDPRFMSEFWQDMFKTMGTKLNISTAFHPATDGQTERTNQTWEQVLRCYVHPLHDDWVNHLTNVEFAINAAQSTSTTMSPFKATLGFEPTTPATTQLATEPTRALPEHVKYVQELHRFAHDCVLEAQTQQISPVAFRLQLPAGVRVHDVVHASMLEKWYDDPDQPAKSERVPIVHDANRFHVQDILDVAFNNNGTGLLFRVRWAFPYNVPSEDTWEPLRGVKHLDIFRSFLLSKPYRQFTESPDFIRDKVMDHLKLNKNGKFKCKEKARKAEVAKRSFVASMEGDEIRRAYLAENPNLMP
eukprot:jgi/Tetstr1/446955/TSEL_034413.t1